MPAPRKEKKKLLGRMRLSAIGALVISLNILGAIALIRLVTMGIERSLKEKISFDIELPEAYNQRSYQELEQEIKAIRGIQSSEYISPDSALQLIKSKHGEDPVKLLGYNPLGAMLRINISAEYTQPDSLQKIQDGLSQLGLDSKELGEQQQEQLGQLDSNVRVIEWVLLFLLVVQGIFTFVQIGNTTRMNIYAQRLQIRTLTLVGASSWFIRRPIILRSLFDAFIATAISLICIAIPIALVDLLSDQMALGTILLSNKTGLLIVSGILLLIALTSSAIASYLSTQRYINMDGRRIHII